MKKLCLTTVLTALALAVAMPAGTAYAQQGPGGGGIGGGKMGGTAPGTPRFAKPDTGDFNAKGDISGNALIGAIVKNESKETVGKIKEVFVGTDGQVKDVVVSVGGFLGVGSRDVNMAWKDVKVSREENNLVVVTSATKESLKSMPEYKP